MPLTTEVLTYPVETLSPFSRPFCLRGMQLFDCLVVTLALFVEARAWRTGSSTPRTSGRSPGRHQRALLCSPLLQDISWNEHVFGRHGEKDVHHDHANVAGRKVKLWGATPIAILPSRAYPAARPETTALWYIALTSILPSVAGVVMVLFHIVGVGASLQLGRFILAFGRESCRHRRGTGAQAHVSAGESRKDIRK